MRQDVAPAADLLERMGAPQRSWRAVHVGGTKGKGSVAALVAAGLERAGWRVGCYASPHVERMNERVRLNGVPVDDDRLAAALERALDAREAALEAGTPARDATWFDVVTAAAFRIFADAEVDWSVVEVGLGGRLDSTNVLSAEASVLTNVELEHTAVLGSTRGAIAHEKTGILHTGGVLVTGVAAEDEEVATIVRARAAAVGAALRWVPLEARGTLQGRNEALAAAVLTALGDRGHTGRGPEARPLAGDLLDAEVVAAARLPGRFERFWRRVPVVLDGAHVAGSLTALLRDLEGDPGLHGPAAGVVSLARDKDAAAFLKAMAARVDRVACTSVASGMHRPPEEMTRLARDVGMVAETSVDPVQALERATETAAARGGWVLVTGSLYLAGALRPSLAGDGALGSE